MKGDENDQGVLVDVVVEGPEELCQEKREEAPLLEQFVLIGLAHGSTILRSRCLPAAVAGAGKYMMCGTRTHRDCANPSHVQGTHPTFGGRARAARPHEKGEPGRSGRGAS